MIYEYYERYIDEQVFRFNNRATKDNPLNDSDRFLLALSQVAGKRLTFAELTGKANGRQNSCVPSPGEEILRLCDNQWVRATIPILLSI
jgi:hypothetical protein